MHLVVQHHQSLVWSYLWRMLRPQADEAVVQDLFQETFLGVHRALPRFSPTGPARLSKDQVMSELRRLYVEMSGDPATADRLSPPRWKRRSSPAHPTAPVVRPASNWPGSGPGLLRHRPIWPGHRWRNEPSA